MRWCVVWLAGPRRSVHPVLGRRTTWHGTGGEGRRYEVSRFAEGSGRWVATAYDEAGQARWAHAHRTRRAAMRSCEAAERSSTQSREGAKGRRVESQKAAIAADKSGESRARKPRPVVASGSQVGGRARDVCGGMEAQTGARAGEPAGGSQEF